MVKKNKQAPFNAKAQTAEKYQGVLNTPSTLEPTVSSAEGAVSGSGTATPKDDDNQQNFPKTKIRRGRRTKDKNLLTELINNPLTWGLVSVAIAVALWGNDIKHSLNRTESGMAKLEQKFENFSEKTSIKLEMIQEYLKDILAPNRSTKEQQSKEFNVFNFSQKKPT